MARIPCLFSFVSLIVACGGGGGSGQPDSAPPRPDAAAVPPAARFDAPSPGAGAAWGELPYPSDLVLDSTGHLKLLTLPAGASANASNVAMLLEGLATLDGAGTRSNVYFPIAGELAAATVTTTSARLIDLDASTASALVEVPCDVLWRDDLASVVVAPRVGVVLKAGHDYGAFLTRAITDDAGSALAPSADFAGATDFATTPADPAIAAAQTSLRPLFDVLPATLRTEVVAATVFRTATYIDDTRAMRDVIAAAPSPTITVDAVYGPSETGTNGLQALYGVAAADAVPGSDENGVGPEPHNHVAVVIHGTVQLPSFLNATPGEDGFPVQSGGAWTIKGQHPVKFTLTLPRTATWNDVPVAIYVHGLGRTRQDGLVLSNTIAREGLATIMIDLNRHGSRAGSMTDTMNEMLNTAGADGFGDGAPVGLFAPIQFFHLVGSSGGIPAGHARALGENLRQAALEISALAELVADGNLAPINAAVGPLTGVPDTVTFRNDVALVTESLGGLIANVAIAIEPRIRVGYVASAAAGLPFPAMMHSPNYGATFLGVLTTPFDLGDRIVLFDAERDARFDPLVMLFGNVVERGDGLAYGPHVLDGSRRGGTPPDLITTMSWGDVWVPNDSTESVVAAMGLPLMPTIAPTPPAQPLRYVTLPAMTPPITGNLTGGRTGAFIVLNPAGHAAIRKRVEQRNYRPVFPPFEAVNPVEIIPDTQTAQIHELLGALLADFAANRAVTIRDPYLN